MNIYVYIYIQKKNIHTVVEEKKTFASRTTTRKKMYLLQEEGCNITVGFREEK